MNSITHFHPGTKKRIVPFRTFEWEKNKMSKITGATLIARSLKQQGIDHLFGVVGFPVGPIAAAAQEEGINYGSLGRSS